MSIMKRLVMVLLGFLVVLGIGFSIGVVTVFLSNVLLGTTISYFSYTVFGVGVALMMILVIVGGKE